MATRTLHPSQSASSEVSKRSSEEDKQRRKRSGSFSSDRPPASVAPSGDATKNVIPQTASSTAVHFSSTDITTNARPNRAHGNRGSLSSANGSAHEGRAGGTALSDASDVEDDTKLQAVEPESEEGEVSLCQVVARLHKPHTRIRVRAKVWYRLSIVLGDYQEWCGEQFSPRKPITINRNRVTHSQNTHHSWTASFPTASTCPIYHVLFLISSRKCSGKFALRYA